MSNNTKYAFIKLGMASMLLLGAFFAFSAIVAYITKFLPLWGVILCAILSILFLGGSEFFKLKRNKYRDIVEYDENGISRRYANFSNLSNQERRVIEQQKMMQREMLIDSVTLKNITHKGEENPEEALNELVGLEDVKKEIKMMAARMQFEFEKLSPKERKSGQMVTSTFTNHMCFMGPPGTGKTVCARIMTGLLYKYHYIKKNQSVEIDGNFFNGSAMGNPSEKAEYILKQASGGVLFIDEAYALMNSYGGREAIATIIKHMEDNRSSFILILAGYDNEMRALIDSNPGFESRIKYWLNFKSYKAEELWAIFLSMAKQNGFTVDESAKRPFFELMLSEMKKPNYGNARTVRNVLDKSIDQHAYNLVEKAIPESARYKILPEDIPIPIAYVSIPVIKSFH